MAGQVFQFGELRLRLVHALLKDIDSGFGSAVRVILGSAQQNRKGLREE